MWAGIIGAGLLWLSWKMKSASRKNDERVEKEPLEKRKFENHSHVVPPRDQLEHLASSSEWCKDTQNDPILFAIISEFYPDIAAAIMDSTGVWEEGQRAKVTFK